MEISCVWRSFPPIFLFNYVFTPQYSTFLCSVPHKKKSDFFHLVLESQKTIALYCTLNFKKYRLFCGIKELKGYRLVFCIQFLLQGGLGLSFLLITMIVLCRFHVDKMSSAHVYVRLQKGQTIDDISEGLLEDCAQLVKANSIQGKI